MGFKYLEEGPTADLMVECWGETLSEAFGNAALAMFNAMTPLEGVEKSVTREFEVDGDDLGALLFNFLDELLYLHDVDLLAFSSFTIEVDEDALKLKAVASGEPFDVDRHVQGIAIKAVTFHQMSIEWDGDIWKITVVLDT
jgi:SHS2 domain-containing protein